VIWPIVIKIASSKIRHQKYVIKMMSNFFPFFMPLPSKVLVALLVYPVRKFFVQKRREVLEMRTSKLFDAVNSNFSKIMMCPHR